MKDSVTIDGVEYVRRKEPGNIRIVILQRGWVVVGCVTVDGDDVTISRASVIRIWGTTTGLGQIAKDGPTSKTVLDACGTVRVHRLAIVASLDCEGSKWTAKLL